MTVLASLDLFICVIIYVLLVRKRSNTKLLYDKISKKTYYVRETIPYRPASSIVQSAEMIISTESEYEEEIEMNLRQIIQLAGLESS